MGRVTTTTTPPTTDVRTLGYIGRERYYEALAYAASIFPSGTVWSELVLGVEPIESTRRGTWAYYRVVPGALAAMAAALQPA